MNNHKRKHLKQLAIAAFLAASMIFTPMSMPTNDGMDTAVITRAAANSFSIKDVPKYDGKATVKVNGNKPYFTEREKKTQKPLKAIRNLTSWEDVLLPMQMFVRN